MYVQFLTALQPPTALQPVCCLFRYFPGLVHRHGFICRFIWLNFSPLSITYIFTHIKDLSACVFQCYNCAFSPRQWTHIHGTGTETVQILSKRVETGSQQGIVHKEFNFSWNKYMFFLLHILTEFFSTVGNWPVWTSNDCSLQSTVLCWKWQTYQVRHAYLHYYSKVLGQ